MEILIRTKSAMVVKAAKIVRANPGGSQPIPCLLDANLSVEMDISIKAKIVMAVITAVKTVLALLDGNPPIPPVPIVNPNVEMENSTRVKIAMVVITVKTVLVLPDGNQ